MQIAHLILVHNQPEQLTRLIQRLSHRNASFFIHIDKKADSRLFAHVFEMPGVFAVKNRISITWGSYSMVQATLNGFAAIIASGKQFDYVNLLSGQDYPLVPAFYIHDFLAVEQGKLFMEFYDVHTTWKEAIPRITQYHLTDYKIPGKHKLTSLINTVMPERKMPQQLLAVGRSQWFTITGEAMQYICTYLDKHPNVARFFRLTWAPDEMIFQTILYNSRFRNDMVNENLRFIDWSEGKASPKTFTINDLKALQYSDKLFARKFNAEYDKDILDALDRLYLKAIA